MLLLPDLCVRYSFSYLLNSPALQLLSNSSNIFIVTAFLEFASIIYNIHFNNFFGVPPLTQSFEPIARATTFATGNWALATVLVPFLAGYLVSFSPAQGSFDPLSASILRLAANYVWVFPNMAFLNVEKIVPTKSVETLDVLGVKWRLVSAAVTLAFAFSEAIGDRAFEGA